MDSDEYDIVFEDDEEIEGEGNVEFESLSDLEERDQAAAAAAAAAAATANASRIKAEPNEIELSQTSSMDYENAVDEVEEVYALALDPDNQVFPTSSLEDAIAALGLPPLSSTDLLALQRTVDPRNCGAVEHDLFLEIMAYQLLEFRKESAFIRRNRDELDHAFDLFTGSVPDASGISIQDLRNAAKAAKDSSVTDAQLIEMINVASGSARGGPGSVVGYDAFARVMELSGAIL
ncbi:uncharacterized protein V1516DRAFT_625133 [Lipomyces oligophaga]|uniref:uncharacterized protein n=1 Tax=Lipomyces oligophaga TaxID=45792 RepID=UPI0034CEC54F